MLKQQDLPLQHNFTTLKLNFNKLMSTVFCLQDTKLVANAAPRRHKNDT